MNALKGLKDYRHAHNKPTAPTSQALTTAPVSVVTMDQVPTGLSAQVSQCLQVLGHTVADFVEALTFSYCIWRS